MGTIDKCKTVLATGAGGLALSLAVPFALSALPDRFETIGFDEEGYRLALDTRTGDTVKCDRFQPSKSEGLMRTGMGFSHDTAMCSPEFFGEIVEPPEI